jgi:hypothetical protein
MVYILNTYIIVNVCIIISILYIYIYMKTLFKYLNTEISFNNKHHINKIQTNVLKRSSENLSEILQEEVYSKLTNISHGVLTYNTNCKCLLNQLLHNNILIDINRCPNLKIHIHNKSCTV